MLSSARTDGGVGLRTGPARSRLTALRSSLKIIYLPLGVLYVKSAGFRKNITLIKMQNKMDFIIFIKRYFLHIAICMHAYNITLL